MLIHQNGFTFIADYDGCTYTLAVTDGETTWVYLEHLFTHDQIEELITQWNQKRAPEGLTSDTNWQPVALTTIRKSTEEVEADDNP